jgi:hypothetical protein
VTACFKIAMALRQRSRLISNANCIPCVYFSKNLDKTEYPALMEMPDQCGLGFLPGDEGCAEMRTDNCSARKGKS